jgi:cytochrome P450 family 135
MTVNGRALPPGPRTPRAVQAASWIARPLAFMERCQARYGDVFTVSIEPKTTWVFFSHPDAIKEIFTGDPAVFHAGEGNVILLPVLGSQSVLLLDDAAHIEQRKLMLPSFHGERMQRYGDLMGEIAQNELEGWPLGESFPIWPRMQALTLEVILRAVFGVTEAASLDRMRAALKSMLDWTTDPRRLLALATFGPYRVRDSRFFKQAMAPVDALILEEIRRRREDPDLTEREDVLSLLLQAHHEDGSPMTDSELRDELVTLLVAGHETTATSLSWAVERLLRNPRSLARLQDEVRAGETEYLDAVIKETLRLRPVIPIVVRKLTRTVEVAGHALPAGVSAVPAIHLVHRRSDVYPDPHSFKPERFLETPPGTYTWIPFGGGPRRCLGASFAQFEMKIVLAAIVDRMTMRPARGEPERIARRAIAMTPRHGAEVVVEERRPARSDQPLEVAA